jgi:hypothetical protein
MDDDKKFRHLYEKVRVLVKAGLGGYSGPYRVANFKKKYKKSDIISLTKDLECYHLELYIKAGLPPPL